MEGRKPAMSAQEMLKRTHRGVAQLLAFVVCMLLAQGRIVTPSIVVAQDPFGDDTSSGAADPAPDPSETSSNSSGAADANAGNPNSGDNTTSGFLDQVAAAFNNAIEQLGDFDFIDVLGPGLEDFLPNLDGNKGNAGINILEHYGTLSGDGMEILGDFLPRQNDTIRASQFPLFEKPPDETATSTARIKPNNPRLSLTSGSSSSARSKTPNMANVSLSRSASVNKAYLEPFIPLNTIQDSYLGNVGARDRSLGMFGTARGVANLTLSYLDKTVASGLATTEQQAGLQTIAYLLKQISRSTASIADGADVKLMAQRATQKFEACMRELEGGTASENVDITDALNICQGTHAGGGSYEICSCVADLSMLPAKSTIKKDDSGTTTTRHSTLRAGTGTESRDEFSEDEGYCFFERLLKGSTEPGCEGNDCGNSAEQVKKRAELIKAVYGDICEKESTDAGTATARRRFRTAGTGLRSTALTADGTEDPSGDSTAADPAAGDRPKDVRFEPQYPSYGVSTLIEMFRNGTSTDGEPTSRRLAKDHETDAANVLSGEIPPDGICPSLIKALTKMRDGEYQEWEHDDKKDIVLTLAQASFGSPQPITPGVLGAILNLCPIESIMNKQFCERLNTWVNEFCDGSALQAFMKMHLRLQAYAQRMAYTNRTSHPVEAEQALGLIHQVTRQMGSAGWSPNISIPGQKIEEVLVKQEVQEKDRAYSTWSAMKGELTTQDLQPFGGG